MNLEHVGIFPNGFMPAPSAQNHSSLHPSPKIPSRVKSIFEKFQGILFFRKIIFNNMAVYTQVTKSQIKEILQAYNLKLISYRPEVGGASNSNFLLKTNKGKYMLTVVEELTKKEAKQWAKGLEWLKKNRFSTTALLRTKTGKLLSIFQKKPILVKKYLAGSIASKARLADYPEIGAGLATLHQVPVPHFMNLSFTFDSPIYQSVIGQNIDPIYEKWLQKRLVFLRKNLPTNLPKGLIHCDLFPDNVLFKGGRFKTILDFEHLANYYFVYDIGMAFIGFCFEKETLNFKQARAFLDGYQSVRKLKKRELKALQLFTEYAAVLMSTWRIWKYHVDTPNPERAEKHNEMMRMAQQVQKMKPQKFLKRLCF